MCPPGVRQHPGAKTESPVIAASPGIIIQVAGQAAEQGTGVIDTGTSAEHICFTDAGNLKLQFPVTPIGFQWVGLGGQPGQWIYRCNRNLCAQQLRGTAEPACKLCLEKLSQLFTNPVP